MTTTKALSILRSIQNREGRLITMEDVFDANDALIDAGDYANAAKLQTLAHLHPTK